MGEYKGRGHERGERMEGSTKEGGMKEEEERKGRRGTSCHIV